MKKIVVFDLDGTLIKSDSFRWLIFNYGLYNYKIIFLTLIRILKIISNKKYAQYIHTFLKVKIALHEKEINTYLYNSLNKDTLIKLRHYQNNNYITLLLSASPEEYVKKFGDFLGFNNSYGSHWINKEEYLHLHGKNKLDFILVKYPKNEYIYEFSIGDSQSDMVLLKEFNEFKLIKKTTNSKQDF